MKVWGVHFDEQAHLFVGLEGVVELDEAPVVQPAHHLHLVLDVDPVLWPRRRDELGGELAAARQLDAPLHLAELAAASNNQPYSKYRALPDICLLYTSPSPRDS